jgi:hypothetical protein
VLKLRCVGSVGIVVALEQVVGIYHPAPAPGMDLPGAGPCLRQYADAHSNRSSILQPSADASSGSLSIRGTVLRFSH